MTIALNTTNPTTKIVTVAIDAGDEKSFEATYLDSQQLKFRSDGENLTLTLPDNTFYPRVTLRRCFPFSTNGLFITVRTPDTEMERGEEIGIINGIGHLDPESHAAISEELKLHYFVPLIKKVIRVKEEYGFINWQVMTDRGFKEFIMRDNVISSTRQISPNRWLLIDINQARYEFSDDNSLDERSRRLMIKHLLL